MNLDAESLKSHIPDRYQSIELLGQGGYGVVFKAEDSILKKTVALKAMSGSLSDSQIARFQQEAQILAKLKHRNILTALDFFTTKDGTLILVLDFIDGIDLDTHIKQKGPMNTGKAVAIMQSLLSGLEYAHSNDILHRDIKPSNVMLKNEEDGHITPKLVDFGLSKWQSDNQSLTRTGQVAGSPLYMSPEQAKGFDVGVTSDIYSSGCLLFYVLTGTVPHEGETFIETISLKQNNAAPRLKDKLQNGDFSEDLETIVARMLEIKPEDRFSSINQVKEALGSARIAEKNAEKRKIEIVPEIKNPLKQSSTFFVPIALSVILVSIGLISTIANKDKEESPVIESASKGNAVALGSFSNADKKRTKWQYYRPINDEYRVIAKSGIKDEDLKDLQKDKREIYWLELNGTEVTGEGLVYVKEKAIKHLDMANCKLTNSGLEKASLLSELTFVGVNGNDTIDDTGLKHLLKLKELAHLKIGQVSLDRKELELMAKMKRLARLDIRYSKKIAPEDLSILAKSKSLVIMSVGGDRFRSEHFRALRKVKSLTSLRIQKIPDKELEKALPEIAKLDNLYNIQFESFDYFPAKFAESLAQMKSLQELKFIKCFGIDRKVTKELKNIPNLKVAWIIDMDLSKKMGCVYDLARVPSIKEIGIDESAFAAKNIIQDKYPGLNIRLF